MPDDQLKYLDPVTETKQQELARAKLMAKAKEEGWRNLAFIDGVLCAVHPFAYTWGIVVGIDDIGYQRRYCYERAADAFMAFAHYTDPRHGHPSGPWVKVKGEFAGQPVDMLNPELFGPDPLTGLPTRKDQHGKQQRQEVA